MPKEKVVVFCTNGEVQNTNLDKVLMSCGFTFTVVENIDVLLNTVSEIEPQLIFVCSSLADEQFAKYASNWQIPMIALLPLGQAWVNRLLLRARIVDFIELPTTSEIIIDTTRRVLEERRSALKQQQLIDDLEKANRTLLRQLHSFKVLLKIAHSIGKILDGDTVLNRITEAAVFITGAEEGYLLLVDDATGKLKLRAAQNLDEKQSRNFNIDINDSIAGQVVQSGKPVMLQGDTTDLFKVKTGLLVKALLNVPLILDGHIIGVLGVDNKDVADRFSRRHLEQLTHLAGVAVTAINNTRQYSEAHAELSAREREISFLQELAGQLATVTDFETGAQVVLSVLLKKLNADVGGLYWLQNASEKPIFIFENTLDDVVFNVDTFQNWCLKDLVQKAIVSNEPILYHRLPESLAVNGTCLIVPLKDNNRVMGTVILLSIKRDDFPVEDMQLVANSAEYMAIALDTILLSQQAYTDHRRLQSLLEAVDNGIWFFDNNLKLITQNRVASDLIGEPLDEVAGLSIEELLPSNNGSPHLIVKLARQALLEQHPVTFSNSLVKLRGRAEPTLVTGHVMPELHQNKVVGIICTLWDVQSVQSKDHSEREFVQMASHLFRTPIGIIQSSIDLLLEMQPNENERVDILKSMRKQSRRLVDTTNELIKILRVGTEDMAVQCLPMAVIPIVNRAMKLVKDDNPSITFEREFSNRLPLALGDEAKTELIIFNLLLNAIRRCAHGGHIIVSVHSTAYEMTIGIEDTGFPLAPEDEKRIFQQFYAVDDSDETMPSTYNFGLHNVRQLVALQRGRIGVESKPPGATKFFFSLPVWEGTYDKNIDN